MLISSNHFFFFRRLHCVEITRVFKSEKLFVELLTFCHEWEAPGAIVTFFSVVSSKRKKKKKKKFQNPTVICVIESRKRRKKRDFVTRSTSGIPTNANLPQSSTTHARVRVHTAVLESQDAGAYARFVLVNENQLEILRANLGTSIQLARRKWVTEHGEKDRSRRSELVTTGLTDFVVCPRERKQTNE